MSVFFWISEATVVAFFVFFVFLAWISYDKKTSQSFADLPLPPGPKSLPIVGNVFDMPTVQPWITFREWSKTYGDVIFLHLPRQPIVILASAKAALDLLDKRPIYADRPPSVMDGLMGWDWNVAMMAYGPEWRKIRRIIHSHFHKGITHQYHPLQLSEARALLRRLMDSPGELTMNIRQLTAAIILKIVYGLEIMGIYDEYTETAAKAIDGLSKARVPGAHWVDYLPFLKHLPTWTPGATPLAERTKNRPFEVVKAAVANGTATSSMARTLIEELQNNDNTGMSKELEEIAKAATGITFVAASDTSTSVLMSFLLAMATYPVVQDKAQAELNVHVGFGRLPEYKDLESLTYIKAIVLETLRIYPVLPLGLPHRVTTDDEYNGYHIPRGSMVMANVWGILHDPEEYLEPERFNPNRFIKDGQLDPNVRDPTTIAFGFGRRICVGRQQAISTVTIAVASILHVFNIEFPRDDQGKPVAVGLKMPTSLITHPEDFNLVFKPRSPAAERLIRESGLQDTEL